MTVDGPNRTSRFADSRALPGSRESTIQSFQGSRTGPLFCESRFGGLKIANRRLEAIRSKRLERYENGGFSREGGNRALVMGFYRTPILRLLAAPKTLFLKAFRNLKNYLD